MFDYPALAAANNQENFKQINQEINLNSLDQQRRDVKTFIDKLDESDQQQAYQYLSLFGMDDIQNEK